MHNCALAETQVIIVFTKLRSLFDVLTFFLQRLSLVHRRPVTESQSLYPVASTHSVLCPLDTVQSEYTHNLLTWSSSCCCWESSGDTRWKQAATCTIYLWTPIFLYILKALWSVNFGKMQMLTKRKYHQSVNVTKMQMSPKLKSHQHANVTKTQMSPKCKFH